MEWGGHLRDMLGISVDVSVQEVAEDDLVQRGAVRA